MSRTMWTASPTCEPAAAVEQIVGAGAVDVFENDVVQAGGGVLAGVEAADDVGVSEHGAVLAFELEAEQDVLLGGLLGGEHLDGDLAIVLAVEGEIDRPHAPLPQPAQDAVGAHLRRLGAVQAVAVRRAERVGLFRVAGSTNTCVGA